MEIGLLPIFICLVYIIGDNILLLPTNDLWLVVRRLPGLAMI